MINNINIITNVGKLTLEMDKDATKLKKRRDLTIILLEKMKTNKINWKILNEMFLGIFC